MVAVAIAAIGLLLAVPRAVPPSEVPLPVVPSGALVEARRREEGRAARLEARAAEERGASGYDLRLAGDLLRQIGLADHAKDRERVSSLRQGDLMFFAAA